MPRNSRLETPRLGLPSQKGFLQVLLDRVGAEPDGEEGVGEVLALDHAPGLALRRDTRTLARNVGQHELVPLDDRGEPAGELLQAVGQGPLLRLRLVPEAAGDGLADLAA